LVEGLLYFDFGPLSFGHTESYIYFERWKTGIAVKLWCSSLSDETSSY